MLKPKKPEQISSSHRKRLLLIGICLFFLFSTLIVQFFKIQVVEGEKWQRKADNQHYFLLEEPFARGTFYSNSSVKKGHWEKEQPFAVDILKFHLFVDPSAIPLENREEIVTKLFALLQTAPADQNFIRDQFGFTASRSRKLISWLERDQRDSVRDWWRGYASKNKIARNALFFVSDYRRSYPFGSMLGQVLHTIQDNKEEKTKQAIPTGGLEAYYNSLLKGKAGRQRLLRSPRNAFQTGEILEKPEDGADIYLTVNHILQAIAEEEIAIGVKKANAKGGWAIMMDPHNGQILAFAQYPFFHPEQYASYFNDPDKIRDTVLKGITDAYEPGSTIKALTLAVCLHANELRRKQNLPPFFSPEEKIPTYDGHFPGRKQPIKDTHPARYLNMYMAMQFSSNIYLGRIIQRVLNANGDKWYHDALYDIFGFSKRTDIELPGESRGMLPYPGKTYASSGKLQWSVPTPYSLAIGYNLQATSVQMLRAWATLANGGYLVEPTLVRKIVKKEPQGIETVLVDHTLPERQKAFPRVLSQEVVDDVVKAVRFVTTPSGSGKRGNVPGYTEVCKTGTTKKLEGGAYGSTKYFSSFIGFTPVKDAAFLLLVAIDEPEATPSGGQYGGVCAAPVFGKIAKRSLEYLGIAPDDPYGYAPGDPRNDPKRAEWYQETKALQEIYYQWNHAN